MVLGALDHVPDDLDVRGCAVEPRRLGREDAVAVEVDAAGPGGEALQGRSVVRRCTTFCGTRRRGGEGGGGHEEGDQRRTSDPWGGTTVWRLPSTARSSPEFDHPVMVPPIRDPCHLRGRRHVREPARATFARRGGTFAPRGGTFAATAEPPRNH